MKILYFTPHLKMYKIIIACGLLFITVLLCAPRSVHAQEVSTETPPTTSTTPQKIVISVGETKLVQLVGDSPFAADTNILGVQATLSGQAVTLSGLRAGTTQLYFWKDGALSFRTVEVTIAPHFISQSEQPTFRPGLPYFLYYFSNSSSFSQNSFFVSPSYGHFFSATFPTRSGHIMSYGELLQPAKGGYVLPAAAITINNHGNDFDFGNTSVGLSQMLGVFSGTSFFGSRVSLALSPSSHHNSRHNLTLFGGLQTQPDLLNFTVNRPRYGSNYLFIHSNPNFSTPDFANFSLTAFQPPDDTTIFNVAGVAEGSFHLTTPLSLGAAYARSSGGGFEMRVRPTYESKSALTQASYSFTQHGLLGVDATDTDTRDYDSHSSYIFTSKLLKNGRTLIGASFSENSTIPKPSSTATTTASSVDSNHGLSGSFNVQQPFGQRKIFILGYGIFDSFSAGNHTLGNSLGVGLTHVLGINTFLNHTLSYFRTDLNDSSLGVGVSNSLNIETDRLHYSSSLTTTVSNSDSSLFSLSLTNSVLVSMPKGSFSTNFSYFNSNLSQSSQWLLLSPNLTYNLTTTQAIALLGGIAYDPSAPQQYNGSLNLQYQRYLGPGVVSDPMWKLLIGKGNKSSVNGSVFLDKNYNSYFDSKDTPISGVHLILDGRKSTATDSQGHYNFKNIKAGQHTLVVDQKSFIQSAHLDEKPEITTKQTFTTTAQQVTTLPLPVTFKRATLRVQFVLDSNDNHKADPEDASLGAKHGYIIDPTGEKRTFSTLFSGGIIVSGIKKGVNLVGVDFLDLPENVEPIGPMEQKINVTEYKEYTTILLYRPLRSVQGQFQVPQNMHLPSGLSVSLGRATSRADAKGYYWLKNLTPGTYKMQVHGLPKRYCLPPTMPAQYVITDDTLALTYDIFLTTDCGTKDKKASP